MFVDKMQHNRHDLMNFEKSSDVPDGDYNNRFNWCYKRLWGYNRSKRRMQRDRGGSQPASNPCGP